MGAGSYQGVVVLMGGSEFGLGSGPWLDWGWVQGWTGSGSKVGLGVGLRLDWERA